jgi:tetratricopeptide (TPR) repeat protein
LKFQVSERLLMDQIAILDQLEAGESVKGTKITPDIAQKYFERMLQHFGTDNVRLEVLGRHWRKLLPRTHHSAWVYRAGGIYERSRGNWRASANAFLDAGSHAKDPLSRASFQVGAIDSLGRAGRLSESEALANRLHRQLRRIGNPGLAARAMLNLGNVLVYQDRMPEARKVLQRASRELTEAGLELEAASANLALSSTHLFGGSPRKAESLAEQVIVDAESLDAGYLADLARLNLALACIVTGRSDRAYEILLQLKPELESSPVDSARVGEYLADALFQLNLWNEAEESYRNVLVEHRDLIPLHAANIELGLGQSLLVQGRTVDANSHFVRANRWYSRLNNRPWQSVCLRLQASVASEAGNRKNAIAKLHLAEKLAANSPYHLCQILLTLSECGEDRLDRAEKIIQKHGYLDLEWQVHKLRAEAAANPGPQFRRMFKSILVGRMATSSIAARIGFIKDKEGAIQNYLGWLLARPSAKRVQEAVSVIEQIRSVTLIDEILRQASIPQSLKDTFQRLREEISVSVDQAPNGHARLQVSGTMSMARAQRAVMDGLMSLDVEQGTSYASDLKSVVLTETKNGLRILSDSSMSTPNLSDREIRELLRWLPFELLAPMADPNVDPAPALKLLQRLSNAFPTLWQSRFRTVCPDGISWRIPWTLCGMLGGLNEEWSTAMHPRMTNHFASELDGGSSAMVWLGKAQDLPFSEREAESIAGKFKNCKILTSAKEVRESLDGKFDAIHVVSHAIHRPQNPMLSTIEFPDGPIFATEIARSELKVKLASLSACETGSISLQTRSEPDGIARAFIARGAQSTIASMWPLDDEAAYRQFDGFYDAIMKNDHIFSALFQSRCICRDWKPHPYYWGALAHYSGYQK